MITWFWRSTREKERERKTVVIWPMQATVFFSSLKWNTIDQFKIKEKTHKIILIKIRMKIRMCVLQRGITGCFNEVIRLGVAEVAEIYYALSMTHCPLNLKSTPEVSHQDFISIYEYHEPHKSRSVCIKKIFLIFCLEILNELCACAIYMVCV